MRAVRSKREGRSPEGRAREIPALLFAALWLIGFELGPALHLARHATLPEHSHCHDGVCHEDDRASTQAEASSQSQDRRGAPEHGENSVEHGGLAALTPSPIVASILGVAFAEILPLRQEPSRIDELARDRARARAPPYPAS